jgi:hypothetical protein
MRSFDPFFDHEFGYLQYLGYQIQCFDTFYDGKVYFDADLNALDDDGGAAYVADFDWKAGNGLICLIVCCHVYQVG